MRNKLWSKQENNFLEKYYPNNGAKYCAKMLNRSYTATLKQVSNLKIKYNIIEKFEKNFLEDIVKNSYNYSECIRKIYYKYNTKTNQKILKKYIKKYNIDCSHFCIVVNIKKIDLSEILIENSTYIHTKTLKNRLYKEGLKERKCEKCGQGEEWNGEHMSLILDHINGKNNDNRLENLRIVCPNCNATLDTFCMGYNRLLNKKDIKFKHKDLCECGNLKFKSAKMCLICYKLKLIKQRKVERPPYEQLMDELKNSNYLQVGKKYGVSDNAIRKWIKNYKK